MYSGVSERMIFYQEFLSLIVIFIAWGRTHTHTHTHSLKFINHFTQELIKTNIIILPKETQMLFYQ